MRTLAVFALGLYGAGAMAQGTVYRCPNNVYTDTISAKEAAAKGCKTLEGAPVTVVQSVRRAAPAAGASRPGERVESSEQRARDSDKRRILEDELKREEDRLAQLQKEFNNGEPERRGDERNYQKYIDRVADLKANIARSESDVAALRREIAKLPAAPVAQ
ncbi:MAG TPA: hypothetical protein VN680_08855 [Burkholderiaceae bacterium]|nr:hypothetical protein [Burkholderiaceae bacterium]